MSLEGPVSGLPSHSLDRPAPLSFHNPRKYQRLGAIPTERRVPVRVRRHKVVIEKHLRAACRPLCEMYLPKKLQNTILCLSYLQLGSTSLLIVYVQLLGRIVGHNL